MEWDDWFVLGILVGAASIAIAIIVGTVVSGQDDLIERAKFVIEQCEKDLPRSATCELIAVPKLQGD